MRGVRMQPLLHLVLAQGFFVVHLLILFNSAAFN
jgi:hypothetical protein